MMTYHTTHMADTRSLLAADKFHLLRRFSIASLAAMLITASALIFLYQQDQFAEHEAIIAQDNEEAAAHIMRLLDDPIYTIISASAGLDTRALQANPNIDLFAAGLEEMHEHNILKLKIFNLSGVTIYSSVKGEIGKVSSYPDKLANALRGRAESHITFRDTFSAATGEMRDVYVSGRYMPVVHAGKRIGVLEIYSDATQIVKRIKTNVFKIALIIFSVFAALYAALFFYVHKTDRAVAEWQRTIVNLNEEIHNLAFHDTLTQLPNRRLLEDRLVQTMAASKRSGLYCALLFLDMDNFKTLNDTHGHIAGDLLLIEAARRLNGCVREMDTVARFGGDEFVVVLGELDVDKARSVTQASIVAEKIRAALGEPYALKIREADRAEIIEHHCTSSIGAVLFVNHGASAEDILRWADTAMYQAKEAGRNLIRFYDLKV